jgi:type IV pilus assembly protein PilM
MLGVDIGNSGVRVMELALHGRQLQIAHYAHCQLPPGAIRDGSVVMREEIAESLHHALRESGSQVRHAALALPPSAVIKKF